MKNRKSKFRFLVFDFYQQDGDRPCDLEKKDRHSDLDPVDLTKYSMEEVVEKHDNEEATNKLEEGGNMTGNVVNSERCLDPSTSSSHLEKSQPFFDLDNPNVYPPIVYPQNTQAVYPQNTHVVYPQNPNIMYPQNPKTRTAGTSTLPSIEEFFPPHYIPPGSSSSGFWKY